MTQRSRSELGDALAARGVSRRDFLRYCASLAIAIGLSEAWAPRIASALEIGPGPKPVVWLGQGLCTGCTESVAQSGFPNVASIVLDVLSVDYWETLMGAAGSTAEKAKAGAIAQGGYVLVVEGAVMRGFDGSACRVAGKSGLQHLQEASVKADAILAVGSCAVDGGWMRALPKSAGPDAVGVKDVPEATAGKPIVNLPGCPANPDWVVAVLVDYLLLGRTPALDAAKRPTLIYGATVHDNCPRRGHFENGEFVEMFGTPAERAGWCLYKMGCKGPQTGANCPVVRWNRKASWCVESGSPCVGCANLDWVGKDAPFLKRMPSVGGINAETVGAVAGAVALGGLAVHGVAQTMTGRMGHGAPPEDEQAEDTPKEGDE